MNHKFDELTKSLAKFVTRRAVLKKLVADIGGLAIPGLLAMPTPGLAATLGPLLELSQPSPVGACDDGFSIPGIRLVDTFEPNVVVNPRNPNNVVATWTLGPIQNVVASVTLNGGRTWQQVPLPLTICSGGPYPAAGDPWLSFAANGDLYAINLAGNSPSAAISTVVKSTDGGLHWSAPALLTTSTDLVPGRPTITVDANNPRFVYAFWHGEGIKNTLPLVFARSTDGGLGWEPARTIYEPGPNRGADFGQAFALPDGTVVALLYDFGFKNTKQQGVQALRSTDHGQSWSGPIGGFTMLPLSFENFGFSSIIDPETGLYVHDPTDPMLATDNKGNLYAVWEDGRFSNFQYNDIAFSMSSDGGLTWSTPIRVNQTPLNIPPLNRQSFLPAIAVQDDGTIGVSYYDFRFNDLNPGLPTDYWMVTCAASSIVSPTNQANWGNEVRVTSASFDLQRSIYFHGYFLGDYVGGLAASDDAFVAVFTAVNQNNIQSLFARRIAK